MTGFQEQKLKCVCWELATDDYTYRYFRYKRKPLGECSDIDEKNTVMSDLREHIEAFDPMFKTLSDAERQSIMGEAVDAVKQFYVACDLQGWVQKEYHDFEQLAKNCSKECVGFVSGKGKMTELLGHCENCGRKGRPEAEDAICKTGTLGEVYKVMFEHRNRCAHNTRSYQHNLPALQNMSEKGFVFENYFLHFTVLIVIDKVIICLFRKYLECSQTNFHL